MWLQSIKDLQDFVYIMTHLRKFGDQHGNPLQYSCLRAGGCSGLEELPTPEARGGGREEQPWVQGVVAAQVQEGLEVRPSLKVRKGSSEEIPLVQGKEQWAAFCGAAMKRYPTPKLRETQVR